MDAMNERDVRAQETVMWTDWYSKRHGWFSLPHLMHIPCSPSHWMPLPEPPTDTEKGDSNG